MGRSWIVGLVAVWCAAFVGAGCSNMTTVEEEAPPAPTTGSEEGDEDSAAERKALEAKLEVAERRLEHARMERRIHRAETAFSIEMAEQEVKLAQSALDQFAEFELPDRAARSELGLQRARDSAAEAAEELAQIELMYAEQDLEDMTAEFVINRGKRNAERAQRSLALQEREHRALTSHELPREKHRKAMELERAQHRLRMAKANAEAAALMKEISALNAERELEELREKLAKLEEKGQS